MLLFIITNLILSSQDFRQITQVLHLDNDVYLVSTKGGTHHAHVYDAMSDSITHAFIRNGGGPGEARGIVAMADCQNDTYVFHSSDGRILHYDKDFLLKGEFLTTYSSINSLYCDSNVISIGFNGIFRTNQLQKDEHYKIGVSYNLETQEKISATYLNGSDIYLGSKAIFNNTQLLMIDFYLARVGNDKYIVSINGSPVIYLIGRKTEAIIYEHEYLNETGFVEITHPAYGYGQKISGVNMSWQLISENNNNEYLFSFGQVTDNLKYGVVKLTYDAEFNAQIEYKLYDDHFQKSLFALEANQIIISGASTFVTFNAMVQQANYLYVVN